MDFNGSLYELVLATLTFLLTVVLPFLKNIQNQRAFDRFPKRDNAADSYLAGKLESQI